MKKNFLNLIGTSLLFLAACSSSTTTTNNNNNNNTTTKPSAPSITYTSGDGYIVAVNTVTTTTTLGQTIETPLGTGVAAFGNLAGGTFNDAGTVTLNGKTLTKNANNTYTYMPSVTDVSGISFDSDINWSVGNPAFTYSAKNNGKGMPNNTKINGTFTSIDVNSDFTLSMTNAVGNADSVYFQITGTSKSIIKRTGGSEKSATFTSAELKTLGNTTYGSVVIAPWNHELKTLGGKQIHVINELALAKVVEIK